MAMPTRNDPLLKLEQLRQAAVEARRPAERDAWLNLAFYLNQQYVTWSDELKAITQIARDPKVPNAPRPIINKIMHFVQQTHASALVDKPSGDVLPATDDALDISDSMVAKAYIDMQAGPTMANYDRQLSRAVLWAVICGQGYLKWMWNKQEKRIQIMPIAFFEGYPDPYARDWTDWRYFIHSTFMDVEQVYESFDKEVKAGQIETADPMRTQLSSGMGSSPVLEGVTVHEIWHKPCKRYPNGMYAVWSGHDFLVAPTDHPYQHKEIPFTTIGAIERPDSQFFQSPVTYGRSPQMALNQYHAQRITHRRMMSNAKWWIDNAIQMDEPPNDSPFQILRGDGGPGQLRPEIIQPPGWPADNDGEMIEQSMMNTFGLHEVSQAQVPGRVEAAKAIETLKEADADRTATLRETISQSNSVGWFQALCLAQQFEPEDVMVMAYSREGIPEVKHFRAQRLKPGFRVKTTMTTGLARSRTAKQDMLINLWTNQIITDPEVMANLLEVPMPNLVSRTAADVRLARNENLELSQGFAIVPNSWDAHDIHVREHNTYRKSSEYRMLSDQDKTKIEFHVQAHEQMLEAELVKQARRMTLAAPVAPSPEGGATPVAPPPTS